MTRLKSRFLVDLLLRRTEAAGGFAAWKEAGGAIEKLPEKNGK